MTGKSGKRNKSKRKAERKFYDANMKATPTQKRKANKHSQATYIKKIRPEVLNKTLRQNQKEVWVF